MVLWKLTSRNFKTKKEQTMRANLLKMTCVFLLVLGLGVGGNVSWAAEGEANLEGPGKSEKKAWTENRPPMPPELEMNEKQTGVKKVESEMRQAGRETKQVVEKGAQKTGAGIRHAGQATKNEFEKLEKGSKKKQR